MNEALLRWLALSLAKRMACLIVASALLLALAWWVLLRPLQQRHDVLVRQQDDMTQQVQLRQQQLAARPSIIRLQSEIAVLLQPAMENVARQTVENLVAARGTQLESWQPVSQPQQLHLRLDWPQFLPLFDELAQAHVSVPQRFELRTEKGALITQMWLEDENAN